MLFACIKAEYVSSTDLFILLQLALSDVWNFTQESLLIFGHCNRGCLIHTVSLVESLLQQGLSLNFMTPQLLQFHLLLTGSSDHRPMLLQVESHRIDKLVFLALPFCTSEHFLEMTFVRLFS